MSPTHSTGPRTEAGKERSSQNATKTGLFAAHDFILEGERDEYTKTLADLWTELQPEGILEETFTSEIMSATWRLRRCRLVEATLATRDLSDEDLAREQKSVARARAQSYSILRRSVAELRKLQTERAIRIELGIEHLPGLADSRQIIQTVRAHDRDRARTEKNQVSILDQLAQADRNLGMQTPFDSSFCNPAASTARNAPSPAVPARNSNAAAEKTLLRS
jgi:hypothetical protein